MVSLPASFPKLCHNAPPSFRKPLFSNCNPFLVAFVANSINTIFCNKKILDPLFTLRDGISKSKPDSQKQISKLYSNRGTKVTSLFAKQIIFWVPLWLGLERPSGRHVKFRRDGRVVTSQKKFLVGNHFRDHILILRRLISFPLKTFAKWRNGTQSFFNLHQTHL